MSRRASTELGRLPAGAQQPVGEKPSGRPQRRARRPSRVERGAPPRDRLERRDQRSRREHEDHQRRLPDRHAEPGCGDAVCYREEGEPELPLARREAWRPRANSPGPADGSATPGAAPRAAAAPDRRHAPRAAPARRPAGRVTPSACAAAVNVRWSLATARISSAVGGPCARMSAMRHRPAARIADGWAAVRRTARLSRPGRPLPPRAPRAGRGRTRAMATSCRRWSKGSPPWAGRG